MKKLVFLTVLMTLIFTTAFSQKNNKSTTTIKNKEWKLLTQKNGIQIYYKYEDCNDVHNGVYQEQVVLKMVNTTDKNIEINWNLEMWNSNNKCAGCSPTDREYQFSLKINAGETKIGTCENRFDNKALVIFSKFLNMENKTTLSKFNLTNISTTIVE